jgi:hypothetical protein
MCDGNELYCPISLEIMEDPVICSDGNSYDRKEIERWLEDHDTSPKTNKTLPDKRLIPNNALKTSIYKYKMLKEEKKEKVVSAESSSDSRKRKQPSIVESVDTVEEHVTVVCRKRERNSKSSSDDQEGADTATRTESNKKRRKRNKKKNGTTVADGTTATTTTTTAIVPAPAVLFIQNLNGGRLPIVMNNSPFELTKVLDLKKMISTVTGVAVEAQRLVYGGKMLDDYSLLVDNNIKPNCTLHLVLRLRGGSSI